MEFYTVQPGDTLWKIAGQFGIPVSRIAQINGLRENESLVVGQTLILAYAQKIVAVQPGQTLQQIAESNGVTISQIYRCNPGLQGLPLIYPGQTLVLSYTQPKRGEIMLNGYVYPYATAEQLRGVLPSLSYMTVFSYGFTPDGDLIIPDDENVLAIAAEYGTQPVMLLSAYLGEEQGFSDELPRQLFAAPAAEEKLIAQLISVMLEKGYRGLDIDFEYLAREDTEAFVAFVTRVRQALNAQGLFVWIALAPKYAADQPGRLYEAFDYRALGEAADGALLMTYEWGYTYGPLYVRGAPFIYYTRNPLFCQEVFFCGGSFMKVSFIKKRDAA